MQYGERALPWFPRLHAVEERSCLFIKFRGREWCCCVACVHAPRLHGKDTVCTVQLTCQTLFESLAVRWCVPSTSNTSIRGAPHSSSLEMPAYSVPETTCVGSTIRQ